jgi:phosphoenolpyruvate-protein kinase (PTS system EI component)
VGPTSQHTPILLSLTLRVRGIVTQQSYFGMHHISQIARECGVPVVDIPSADMERIADGTHVSLNGSKGTVTIG